jgi:4-hydroxybenzoyl-CoA reductase subunit beta
MLRLPPFTYLQPRTLDEALRMKGAAGPDGMYVAGGTDLYPNMKRRHQEPTVVVSLAGVPELRSMTGRGGKGLGLAVGACATLTEVAHDSALRASYGAVAHAAEAVPAPARPLVVVVPDEPRAVTLARDLLGGS